MLTLNDYIRAHVRVLAAGEKHPKAIDVSFHSVVVTGEPDAAQFRELAAAHKSDFPLDPFDGKVHQYPNLLQWLGDPDDAAHFMALAFHLELADLQTPKTAINPTLSPEEEIRYREMGMLFMSLSTKERFKLAAADGVTTVSTVLQAAAAAAPPKPSELEPA